MDSSKGNVFVAWQHNHEDCLYRKKDIKKRLHKGCTHGWKGPYTAEMMTVVKNVGHICLEH